MVIVGITGTLGAGKGTVVEYLEEEKNFAHFSVRDYLVREMERRGLANNRDNMVTTANDLREKNSPSFIIEELYKEAKALGKNAVIESIRTPGEVEFLKNQGHFILLAVDADPEIRYQRIRMRKSTTDDVDYQTFLSNEAREFTSTDPNKQNLKKCIEMADLVITNNGSMADLFHKLEDSLASL
jgi:dephospho-CoA kinase